MRCRFTYGYGYVKSAFKDINLLFASTDCRLYKVEIKGLQVLWKVVLGKRKNLLKSKLSLFSLAIISVRM